MESRGSTSKSSTITFTQQVQIVVSSQEFKQVFGEVVGGVLIWRENAFKLTNGTKYDAIEESELPGMA